MHPPATSWAVELDGVKKKYGDQEVVHGVTLRIGAGTKYGLIGPNGAGKTTTIRMIMGLTLPTEGSVRVLGLDPRKSRNACRIRIGYVPEEHLIYRWMRVGEVTGFCRRLYPTWNDAVADRWLDAFGLSRSQKVKTLSKGMLAKLSLLLALAPEPELLLLDEPTSGLDPLIRDEFLDGIVGTLCEQNQTVLFSSHILSDVRRLADRIGIMNKGRIVADCPADDLVARTKRVRAVLRDGRRPASPVDGIIWEAVEGGEWLVTLRDCDPEKVAAIRSCPEVREVKVTDLDLDEIFKDYVRGGRGTA